MIFKMRKRFGITTYPLLKNHFLIAVKKNFETKTFLKKWKLFIRQQMTEFHFLKVSNFLTAHFCMAKPIHGSWEFLTREFWNKNFLIKWNIFISPSNGRILVSNLQLDGNSPVLYGKSHSGQSKFLTQQFWSKNFPVTIQSFATSACVTLVTSNWPL